MDGILTHWVYTDPYAGGERPGRLAKPDAVSAIANHQARECALLPSSQPTLVGPLTPMLLHPLATQPIPGTFYFACNTWTPPTSFPAM